MSSPTARPRRRPLGPALIRYRVMAIVTGSMLVLLTLEIVLKYGFNSGQPVLGAWIAIAHGWIYVIYLMTVVDLWSTVRWGIVRLLQLVLAGIVPGLSFYAEHWVTREVRTLMISRGEIAPTATAAPPR